MTFLIGQAPDEPCLVCDLSPVALRQVEGFPELAQCARCGFAYTVRNLEGDRLATAVPSVSHALASVFRQYYETTGHTLGLPAIILEDLDELDPDQLSRSRAMDEWLRGRPHLLAGAMAPASWPFVSLTALRAEIDGRPVWQVISPPNGIRAQLVVPFPPDCVPVGTIVTISIPIEPTDVRPPAEPEIAGSA